VRSLFWAPSFTRAFRKYTRRHPDLAVRIRGALEQLVVDPFAPVLDTHKLWGELTGLWACSVAYDCRIVFDFVDGRDSPGILLIDIGTHDEVY
jgi:mRNA-degrading endonuclease YafQ of YafQ-DinJ toxin-antitoxin module